jgi:large subunit ribosomal protein L6
MSRIGQTPVELPKEVTVTQNQSVVTITGPKGTLTLPLPNGLRLEVAENRLVVSSKRSEFASIHGLFRALVQNNVTGVTKGWEKTVELVGVGYKATGGGAEVTFAVGYTHPVKIVAPNKDIAFKVTDNTQVTVSGIDKKIVGEITAKIRAIKPPEPYKGKGIRYVGEVVRKKAGKAIKAAGAPA